VFEGRVSYAPVDDGEVAFFAVETKSGSPDLLHIPGQLNHIESATDEPAIAAHYSQLAAISRLVMYDRRGSGLSTPLPRDRPATIEERADEALAVLDALGIDRTFLYSTADGTPVALFLAATHPERISALVLYAPTARYLADEDYPGFDPDSLVPLMEEGYSRWGDDQNPTALDLIVPSRRGDVSTVKAIGRMQRRAGTPMAARRFWELFMELDVREVLDGIRVPTLVLHRRADLIIPFEQGQYVASQIQSAQFVELPGTDHFYFWDHADDVAREIGRFLHGTASPIQSNRVLATVMFSDIVGSTERTAEIGDSRWGEELDRHDGMAHQCVDAHGGRFIRTMGDGFLATFDGPGRAIQSGLAIRDGARRIGVDVRIGLHTGEVETRDDDVGGIAVNLGARVGALAGPGEVLVSGTVKDLVAGSGIEFEDRGEHELKGVPGNWRLFAVKG
jgi:class 3 adenylate cyclase